jgi:hypothetical protein
MPLKFIKKIQESFCSIGAVWLRYFFVFIKSLPYYLLTTFLEPLLYLLSFGLGVGSLVGSVQTNGTELTYRSFIFSGIIAQTVLFQGFYEGAFGAFVRMYYQRIFQAIANTPVNSLIRTLTLGLPFQPFAVWLVIFWCVVLVYISRRSMMKRLVK